MSIEDLRRATTKNKESRRIIVYMGKYRLLDVEDDVDIANMIKIYFSGMDFDVDIAVRGLEALEKIKQVLPHLIVLDIMLPDIDGYEVCRNLRSDRRTSHIPIIFLTQKDERSDKLEGLELGVEDYITKPFDIEELKLRVLGIIRRSLRENLTDPRSGLPAGRLIEEHLRRIIREKGWSLLDTRINNFEPFQDVYGFAAGDEVLRMTAMLIEELMDELGTKSDFLGHVGGDNFIVTITEEKASKLKYRLKERFAQEIQTHYNFIDRQQGFVQAPSPDRGIVKIPFMTMSVGIVSSGIHSFADTREIIELAAEASRQDTASEDFLEEQLRHTIWEMDWAYIHLHIKHLDAYQEVYGINKSNEVIWLTARMIKEVMSEIKLVDSFVGHEAKDKFVIILPEEFAQTFREKLKSLFDIAIPSHYHYIHREHGYIRTNDQKKHPLMKLAVGMVRSTHQDFVDIRKVAELAEYACAMDE